MRIEIFLERYCYKGGMSPNAGGRLCCFTLRKRSPTGIEADSNIPPYVEPPVGSCFPGRLRRHRSAEGTEYQRKRVTVQYPLSALAWRPLTQSAAHSCGKVSREETEPWITSNVCSGYREGRKQSKNLKGEQKEKPDLGHLWAVQLSAGAPASSHG